MKIRKTLKDIYLKTVYLGLYNWIPTDVFLKIQYKAATKEKLNLLNPKTYNEKIQWIKMYDHNPLYIQFADKYKVREYVKERIGEEYLIPIYKIWKNVNELDILELPDQFVLKNNHDSGGVFICKNKNEFDIEKTKSELKKRMNHNYFYVSREWGYKYVEPCVIAEKYLIDKKSNDLKDYKIFCFAGKPKYIQVDYDRFINHKRNIYDTEWNFIDLSIKCDNDVNKKIERPKQLECMLNIATKLSEGFPQLRVDLYEVEGKVYFGELTVYHGGGFEKFTPKKYEETWGNMVDLKLAYKE